MKRESLNRSIQSPHFQSSSEMTSHSGGTYSRSGTADFPRASIAELNLGKFLDSMEFQCWKLNIRTEVCPRTADPQIIMLCIKKVEIGKSFDELLTSRSIMERHVEEQRTQKHIRFSQGRQIACMIYEYFRATGAYEAVQGLEDLFTMSLQNDDVQYFDVRWDHALLSVSEMPSNVILEGFFKEKKYSILFNFRVCWLLFDQEVARNNGKPNCSRIKDSCKTSY